MRNIDNLIDIGKTHTFKNNSIIKSHGVYTKASDDLLSWIAVVEDFIKVTYGEESAAFKLYNTFDRRKLNGYEQDSFDKQIAILLGALKACKNISPAKTKNIKEDHQIIQLIKNAYFWTALGVAIGSAFTLGNYFGTSKFDAEKATFYNQVEQQKTMISKLEKDSLIADSTIKMLNIQVLILKDSLLLDKDPKIR